MNLHGRVALVTGATGGLGQHIVTALSSEGAAVVVHYKTREQKAQDMVHRLHRAKASAIAVRADVCVEEDVQQMVKETIESFGRIDVLINNAGISRDALSWRMSSAMWHEVLEVNLTGVFYSTKAVLPYMREAKWGRIINMTSVVAQMGVPGTAAYAASKAGIIGLTKTVAREVITRGITVNCLALGYFREGMFLALREEIQQAIVSQIPMGRLGEPSEVAVAIKFLCSEETGYITGQVINLNGGLYM